jgi:hypothetical protein
MKKGLYLVLSLLVVFSLGVVFLHCGDDDGECTCPDGEECCAKCKDKTCPDGEVCWVGGNECTAPCCPGQMDPDKQEYFISVAGKVIDLTTQQPVDGIGVAPIAPMDALLPGDPTHLDDQVTGADGTFQTECFDVKTVALGCVMLADDEGTDYFPTGTGVKAWDENADKWCVFDAMVFAIPNTLVAGLDMLPNIDSASEGFVMGFVVDSTGSMVEGAVIKKVDDEGTTSDLTSAYYPIMSDPPDLTTGTATSAAGIFVLPGENFNNVITKITAEKTGHTFAVEQASNKAGFCYFTPIQEE